MYVGHDTKPTGKWKGRSLENYIEQHKAKHPEVVNAKTLTEARRICFGEKKKRIYDKDTNTRS